MANDIKDILEKYNDGVTTLTVTQEYLNGYTLIQIQGSQLDNYNAELFLSVIYELHQASIRNIVWDLSEVGFVSLHFFHLVFVSFGKVIDIKGGNQVIASAPRNLVEEIELDGWAHMVTVFGDVRINSVLDEPFIKEPLRKHQSDWTEEEVHKEVISWKERFTKHLEWRKNPWVG